MAPKPNTLMRHWADCPPAGQCLRGARMPKEGQGHLARWDEEREILTVLVVQSQRNVANRDLPALK